MRNNWATYAYAAPDEGVAEQISALQSELCKALSLEPVENPHLRCEARSKWLPNLGIGAMQTRLKRKLIFFPTTWVVVGISSSPPRTRSTASLES